MSKKKQGFEETLQELETIVEQLEANELSLEEAIAAFEHGQKLIGQCEKELMGAEKKLQELNAKQNG